MILALLLSFDKVAEVVSKATGVAKDTITTAARVALVTLIGMWFVTTGVAALAVPVVGIILIVIGVALIAYAWWPYIFGDREKGQKPDNTKL